MLNFFINFLIDFGGSLKKQFNDNSKSNKTMKFALLPAARLLWLPFQHVITKIDIGSKLIKRKSLRLSKLAQISTDGVSTYWNDQIRPFAH